MGVTLLNNHKNRVDNIVGASTCNVHVKSDSMIEPGYSMQADHSDVIITLMFYD